MKTEKVFQVKRVIQILVVMVLLSVFFNWGVYEAVAEGSFNITVTNTYNGGAGSLRDALATASNGDTITFAPSLSGQTIHLYSTLTLSNNVTIDGSGKNITISGDNVVRVMNVNSGVVATLKGLSIINGFVNGYGGGIYNVGTLTINDCTISGNRGNGYGGGIYNSGTLTINDCIISGNLVRENSGNFYNVLIAEIGGGIYNTGTLTIADCTISSNTASVNSGTYGYGTIYVYGGGVYNSNTGTLTITNSTFSTNTASANPSGGTWNISTFGGGAYNEGGTLTITNSTFFNNISTQAAGAIFSGAGTLTIKNSTISNNSSGTIGGIEVYRGRLNYVNTILANSSGLDCALITGIIGTNTRNLVESNSGCGTPYLTADPKLSTLANNGGTTQTMALLAGSPAIDAGDDATCAETPINNLDQRGAPRPIGTHCDIGAFESGQYAVSGNAGTSGATLSYINGNPQTSISNGYGNYTFFVPSGWYGTVTPSKIGYIFSPNYTEYTNVTTNFTGQNYTAKSTNADLSNLVFSTGALDPVFDTGTTAYAQSVANAVASITVTPTVADATASVMVNGAPVASGAASGTIALSVGSNAITIIVTAEDGTTTKTYTVTVTRAPSSNASLSNLVLSTGTLTPTFDTDTTDYTQSVANAATSLTVTPTVADATATITVNGAPVTSGTASGAITLSVGENTITTIVTAEDGVTTKTYTVTVTRAVPSINADLSGLVLSTGVLTPVFDTGTISYTQSVDNAVTSLTVTPTVADATASVMVNGAPVTSGAASGTIALSVGSNAITIIVTAEDGTTTKTYTVTVTRAPSSNASLSNLVLSTGALTPLFDTSTTTYTQSVAYTATSLTVTPTVADATATVTVNGIPVASGTASGAIPLSVGSNTITTIVTAEDGITTETYTVTITRAMVYTITGNAGESGVTLRYTDGTAKSVTSGSNGRYTITVPYNWSGSVTPSKTGLTFSPTSKSYSHITANQASQNYYAVMTILSTGSYDGWVLESSETSSTGGSLDATATTFILGDNNLNRQYRAILSFNTATLPDTAVLQSVVVKIKQSGSPVGTSPFSALGSLYADIRKGYFGTSVGLQTTDFNAAASTTSVAATFGKTPVSAWYSATLTSTGRSYVNKTSWTQLRLRFSTDDNNNRVADYMRFVSGNYSSSSYRPQLIITYTLP